MTSFLSSTWLLFQAHLGASLRARRFWICLALGLVPPGLAWLADHQSAMRVAGWLTLLVVLQVIAPLVGLVLGSAVVTEELENRTLTFPFTRPIPRAALLLGRYLATVVLVALVLVPSCLGLVSLATLPRDGDATSRIQVTIHERRDSGRLSKVTDLEGERHYVFQRPDGSWHRARLGRLDPGEDRELGVNQKGREVVAIGGAYIPLSRELVPGFVGRLLLAALLAGALYALVTAGIGTLLRRPMVFGLGYAFAMEFVLANIPGSSQSLSLQYYLRGILVGTDAEAFRRFPPIRDTEFLTPLASATHLGVILAVGLALASWVVSRRQYMMTS